jgi:hypothetical protein
MTRRYPLSARINHIANDREECCAALELAEVQDRLFS